MTKDSFLDSLRAALNGKVLASAVTENINFYEDYINTEMRKGKTEEEVLELLGDPRLIAKTIVETGAQSSEAPGGRGGSSAEESRESARAKLGRGGELRLGGFSRFPLWVWLILAIVIVVLVVSAVLSVLSAVLPVLLPILVVLFLVKLFRDWIN